MNLKAKVWLAMLLANQSSAISQEKDLYINPVIDNVKELPVELNLLWTSFLPNRDLLTLRQVGKYWKEIAEDVLEKENRTLTINVAKLPDYPIDKFSLKIKSFHFVEFFGNYRAKFLNFVKAISHPDLVKKLSFANNRLGKTRLGAILPMLETFKNIECLDLSYNHITFRILEKLPKYLLPFERLQYLNLNENLINDLTGNTWVQYLGQASSLKNVVCLNQRMKKGAKNQYEKLMMIRIPLGELYVKMN